MSRASLLFLIFFFPVMLFSQNSPGVPPGTIRMPDGLYIDRVPVTNLMYLEFLSSVGSFWDSEMHQTIQNLPKYAVNPKFRELNTDETTEQIFVRNPDQDKLRDPKYRQDPVVQISKREAEMFCRWRTDMVMLLWAIRSRNAKERKEYPAEIRYRLPGTEEYEAIKTHFSDIGKLEDRDKFPSAGKYNSEPTGEVIFYDLAEITYDNEIFGEKEVNPETLPNESVGFRCVCEVVETPSY